MGDLQENMTQMEMIEKIAELDYSQSHLRDLNAKMRHWLDAADEDMAALRSENIGLRQQVKALEKMMSEAQQVEAEPCGSLLADDHVSKRCREEKVQALEKECTILKEQNKKLTEELKFLEQQRNKDQTNLSKLKDDLQNLECQLEDAQFGLQHRDEFIQQTSMRLKHSEEMVEECSNIIKDLRLSNQELKAQMEDRLYETSLPVLNDVVDKDGLLSSPLSFAEEIQLLVSPAESQPIFSHSADLRHEETEAEDQLEPKHVTADTQIQRCAGPLESRLLRAGLILLFLFMLFCFVFVASGSHVGSSFSINTLWSGARLMLQPYWTVHYGALPPV